MILFLMQMLIAVLLLCDMAQQEKAGQEISMLWIIAFVVNVLAMFRILF